MIYCVELIDIHEQYMVGKCGVSSITETESGRIIISIGEETIRVSSSCAYILYEKTA